MFRIKTREISYFYGMWNFYKNCQILHENSQDGKSYERVRIPFIMTCQTHPFHHHQCQTYLIFYHDSSNHVFRSTVSIKLEDNFIFTITCIAEILLKLMLNTNQSIKANILYMFLVCSMLYLFVILNMTNCELYLT